MKLGNPVALQVLLDAGADIAEMLDGSAHDDITEYAKAFNGPNVGEVVSVLVDHLMQERLREVAGAGAACRVGVAMARRRAGHI